MSGMITSRPVLYHMPFCPLSRKIVFGVKEKAIDVEESIEKTWSPSDLLFSLNSTGELPVFKDREVICCNDYVACEYLEEAYPQPPLLSSLPAHRVHVRNIMSWFDKIFYQDVYLTLFYERALKRHIEKRGPDTLILKKGRTILMEHLMTINHMAEQYAYLAGKEFSWADIAGASHLSCIDYLGDIPWSHFPSAKEWYMKIKSRPSFRSFLKQSFPGIAPAPVYPQLDF